MNISIPKIDVGLIVNVAIAVAIVQVVGRVTGWW
jgi:hypothetical protein